MRRADRLFQLVQLLRARRLTTARQLADWLEVSERTIYRDVADLVQSGVPIDGEAGVGYRLAKSFDLPPLAFDRSEIEALALGARMVDAWADPELKGAARSALGKIAGALPRDSRDQIERLRVYAPDFFIDPQPAKWMKVARRAIYDGQVLNLTYVDADGRSSERAVRPLGLFFWGQTWTCVAWCELRDGFRSFRLDRVTAMAPAGRPFVEESGRRLHDFLRAVTGNRTIALPE